MPPSASPNNARPVLRHRPQLRNIERSGQGGCRAAARSACPAAAAGVQRRRCRALQVPPGGARRAPWLPWTSSPAGSAWRSTSSGGRPAPRMRWPGEAPGRPAAGGTASRPCAGCTHSSSLVPAPPAACPCMQPGSCSPRASISYPMASLTTGFPTPSACPSRWPPLPAAACTAAPSSRHDRPPARPGRRP